MSDGIKARKQRKELTEAAVTAFLERGCEITGDILDSILQPDLIIAAYEDYAIHPDIKKKGFATALLMQLRDDERIQIMRSTRKTGQSYNYVHGIKLK